MNLGDMIRQADEALRARGIGGGCGGGLRATMLGQTAPWQFKRYRGSVQITLCPRFAFHVQKLMFPDRWTNVIVESVKIDNYEHIVHGVPAEALSGQNMRGGVVVRAGAYVHVRLRRVDSRPTRHRLVVRTRASGVCVSFEPVRKGGATRTERPVVSVYGFVEG